MSMAIRAMDVDPLSHNVRRMHALQLLRELRFSETESAIQEFITANPDDPTPYELWGDMLMTMGSPQNAIPMFEKAHHLRPGDIYMAAQSVQAGLQLDDAKLVTYWLNEARARGSDGRWTRTAENLLMYANGDFDGLLKQADYLLESLPGKSTSMAYRGVAQMSLGRGVAAQESFQSGLDAGGYINGKPLTGDQLTMAVQLANAFDHNGKAAERDDLVGDINFVLEQILQVETKIYELVFIKAGVASIQNNLPGVLHELQSAVEIGFRDHWELLRNPVFKRWQEHPDFIAFHQGMLDRAAVMRQQYYANNPAEGAQ